MSFQKYLLLLFLQQSFGAKCQCIWFSICFISIIIKGVIRPNRVSIPGPRDQESLALPS
ncbi:hypothetical protein pb186bvf_014939 [Paramecium bursaria]